MKHRTENAQHYPWRRQVEGYGYKTQQFGSLYNDAVEPNEKVVLTVDLGPGCE